MGRFQRSITLFKASLSILKEDKKLMMLPMISFLVSFIVLGSYVVGAFFCFLYADIENINLSPTVQTILEYSAVFIFYFTTYFIIIFFNAVIVSAVYKRLNGENLSLREAFKLTFSRFGLIFKWALLSATIGLVLRLIEERLGFIARIVIGFLGLAWTVISYFVLPVLIVEGKGPITAVKQSASILKKAWGESLLGFGGLGLIFMGLYLPLIGLLSWSTTLFQNPETVSLAWVVSVVSSIGMLMLILLNATLTSIYRVAIYQYASTGERVRQFTPELIQENVIKRKKRWFSK